MAERRASKNRGAVHRSGIIAVRLPLLTSRSRRNDTGWHRTTPDDTGRHVVPESVPGGSRLRIRCPKGRGSSTLASRTTSDLRILSLSLYRQSARRPTCSGASRCRPGIAWLGVEHNSHRAVPEPLGHDAHVDPRLERQSRARAWVTQTTVAMRRADAQTGFIVVPQATSRSADGPVT